VKKFNFRLQTVLELRTKAFDDCQLELAKVQNKYNQTVSHLEYLYDLLAKSKKSLEDILSKNIDFTIINCYKNYIAKLEECIKNQHKIISDIEVELEAKKNELLEAMKAKKMLEILKEKDLKAFHTELERQDKLIIDEIATNRYKKA